MNHQRTENYLRAHRKKSGLSQREVGKLLGYRGPGPVVRHERLQSIPPLTTALAYEVIFRVSVSLIFVGIHEKVRQQIEDKLTQLEADLGNRDARDPDANVTAQKLLWLTLRKSQQTEQGP